MQEQPDPPRARLWRHFLLAAVLIVLVSGGATAAVALNTVGGLADEIFTAANKIHAPKGLIIPEYNGGPQTFLILGSDRREGSKDAADRLDPPHSDTILLVRFDPEQGQTSVMSIPRDLLVTIETRSGETYPDEKVNAAYTIGASLGGASEASLLAAETIKREIFPELKLNGIVDVDFRGFMRVVDTLGCAYVQVDHRYYNENVGTPETNYTSIDLQPGYQKLCYENALDYVRYRHTDSDFVRVARQQDFLRDLRDQVNPEDVLGQIDKVAKAVGGAIRTTFPDSGSELIELAKLVAFSQNKPIRQVPFQYASEDTKIGEGDYVTSTPELERATLHEFLYGAPRAPRAEAKLRRVRRASARTVSRGAANFALVPSTGEEQARAVVHDTPVRVLYPALQTVQAQQEQVRAYRLRDEQGRRRNAYVIVWMQNIIGGYYDLEGSDWADPPLFDHSRSERIGGRDFKIVDDGAHIDVIGWHEGRDTYWLTNTLLEELSNPQMIRIALSVHAVR